MTQPYDAPDAPLAPPVAPPTGMPTFPGTPAPEGLAPAPSYAGVPATMAPTGTAPIGKIRGTGACIALTIVTLGFYSLFWYYATHEEMKRHSGEGLGGGLALVIGFFVGIVMAFLTPGEVGKLYERRGQKPPVSAVTGLWMLLLGWFFFVGAIVWFVKTNGALNAYWRSLGAR